MQIEYTVERHPSGRLTLKERTQMAMLASDCGSDLLANADAGSFYKAVAAKLYAAHKAGHVITYIDDEAAA